MSEIILIRPSIGRRKDEFYRSPISLLVLASKLWDEGYSVHVLDVPFSKDWQAEVDANLDEGTLCIGITSSTGNQLKNAAEISSYLRSRYPEVPVVLGGDQANVYPEITVASGAFDFIVKGYGELALLRLVKELQKHKEKKLGWKTMKPLRVQRPEDTSLILGIEGVDFTLVDMDKYMSSSESIFGNSDKVMSIYTQLGCSGKCTYCHNENKDIVKFDVGPTIDKMIDLSKSYRVNNFIIEDSDFLTDRQRVKSFCKEMTDVCFVEEVGPFKWSIKTRLENVMKLSDDYIKMLAESGCTCIHIGIESGSEKINKDLGKGTLTIDSIEQLQKLNSAGITLGMNLIIGFPDESKNDMMKTMDLPRLLQGEGISISYVLGSVYIPKDYPKTLDDCMKMDWGYDSAAPWLSKENRHLVHKLLFLLNSRFYSKNPLFKTWIKTRSLLARKVGLIGPMPEIVLDSRLMRFPPYRRQ